MYGQEEHEPEVAKAGDGGVLTSAEKDAGLGVGDGTGEAGDKKGKENEEKERPPRIESKINTDQAFGDEVKL